MNLTTSRCDNSGCAPCRKADRNDADIAAAHASQAVEQDKQALGRPASERLRSLATVMLPAMFHEQLDDIANEVRILEEYAAGYKKQLNDVMVAHGGALRNVGSLRLEVDRLRKLAALDDSCRNELAWWRCFAEHVKPYSHLPSIWSSMAGARYDVVDTRVVLERSASSAPPIPKPVAWTSWSRTCDSCLRCGAEWIGLNDGHRSWYAPITPPRASWLPQVLGGSGR